MRWIGIAAISVLALTTSASEDDTLTAAARFAKNIGASGGPVLAQKLKDTIVVTNPKLVPPADEPVLEAWLADLLASPEWNLAVAKVVVSHLQPEDVAVLLSQTESAAWRHYQEVRPNLEREISAQLMQTMREQTPELQRRLREAKGSR